MNIFRLYMCMTILSMNYKRLCIRLSFMYIYRIYIISVVINGGGKE